MMRLKLTFHIRRLPRCQKCPLRLMNELTYNCFSKVPVMVRKGETLNDISER